MDEAPQHQVLREAIGKDSSLTARHLRGTGEDLGSCGWGFCRRTTHDIRRAFLFGGGPGGERWQNPAEALGTGTLGDCIQTNQKTGNTR